jgi:hypothetical protein
MNNNRRRCAKWDTCSCFFPKACWYEIDSNSIGIDCVMTQNLPCVVSKTPKIYEVGDYVTILKTPYWVFQVEAIYPEGEDVFGVKRKVTLYRVKNTENMIVHNNLYIGSSLCEANELSDKIDINKYLGVKGGEK